LNTSAAGTIDIEWFQVTGLESNYDYQVEISGGEQYFGTLKRTKRPGELKIVGSSETTTVALSDVVLMEVSGQRFWQRMRGSVNAGFSYTQSNKAVQYSLSGNVHYRGRKSFGVLDAQSIFSNQENVDATKQNSMTALVAQKFSKNWFIFELGQVQSNPDLGFDLRGVLGGGVGHPFINNSKNLLNLLVGPMYNREAVTDSGDVDSSVEALVGLQLVHIQTQRHAPLISLGLNTFTAVSGSSRFRAQLYFNITWKIIAHMNFSFNIREEYDSAPPGTGANNNDLSVITSVGYSF
jgi:putative salt-induced outer membrane protein YdiY